MKHITRDKRKRGFTILELIVAIFIVITGLVAAASLMTYSISAVIIGKSQIIATNLAQEGLEVVRNIRDNNWHCIADPDCTDVTSWNEGLGVGEWRVEYDSLGLSVYTGNSLKLYDGFYQYTFGDETYETRFYRKITIEDISANEIKVVSEVTFSERNKSYSVSAENRLYDWK